MSITVSLFVLFSIYTAMAIYFTDHFFFGSEINNISISGKSIEDVKEQMTSELQEYTLILKERDGDGEQIRGSEIGLMYSSDEQFYDFKERQNPFKWFSALFYMGYSRMKMEVSYDEGLLNERVDRLCCFDENNIIEPENPVLKYTKHGYVIVDEVYGNKVNRDILYEHIVKAILNNETEVDLEAIGCYIKPQYTYKSWKVVEAKGTLDKYVSSRITYIFGQQREIIDGSILSSWLEVDENFEIVLNENKVKDYIDALSRKHSKTGRVENFITSSGDTISINGGDYSCMINCDEEVQELCAAIREGRTMTKEPKYNISTYVEIDLSRQHLWFYKNSSLIAQGDIVSGNMDRSHATPGGIYKLKAAVRNAVLRGPDYAAPVDYWMPFNGGIGIHDATWRSAFGGNIYKYDGSHGCINCPYSLAKIIFENIEVGTPVICYY